MTISLTDPHAGYGGVVETRRKYAAVPDESNGMVKLLKKVLLVTMPVVMSCH